MAEEEAKKKESFISKYWTIIVLLIFVALFLWQDIYFVYNNRAPSYGDAQFHLVSARREFRVMFEGDKVNRSFYSAHPPLVYLNSVLFFLFLGKSIQASLVSLLLFSLVFIFSAYGIGSHLGGKEAGLACALVVISCHYFLELSHRYLLDMPQASLTALAIYFLLKSKFFSDFKYSIFFGIALSLIMFTKWTGLFYLAPALIIIFAWLSYRSWKTILIVTVPFLVIVAVIIVFYKTGMQPPGPDKFIEGKALIFYLPVFLIMLGAALYLRKKPDNFLPPDILEKGKAALNGVTAILLCAVINTPWYVYSQLPIVAKINGQKTEMAMRTRQLTEPIWAFNLKNYLSAYRLIFPLFFLLALVGLIFIFFKKENRFELLLMLLMGCSGVGVILFSAVLSIPYVITILLFIAVFAGYWIKYTGKFRYVILSILGVYAFISLIYPLPFGEVSRQLGQVHHGPLSFSFIDQLIPDQREYYIDEAVSDLKKDIKDLRYEDPYKRIPLAVEITEEFRNPPQEKRMQRVESLIFQTHSWYQNIGHRIEFILFEDWRNRINDFKDMPFYIYICHTDKQKVDEIKRYIEENTGRKFRIISSYELEDGRKITLGTGSSEQ